MLYMVSFCSLSILRARLGSAGEGDQRASLGAQLVLQYVQPASPSASLYRRLREQPRAEPSPVEIITSIVLFCEQSVVNDPLFVT